MRKKGLKFFSSNIILIVQIFLVICCWKNANRFLKLDFLEISLVIFLWFDTTLTNSFHLIKSLYTRHFCAQYCDKKIKRHFEYLELSQNKYFQCTQEKKHWMKNVFCLFLQYLLIFLLQYCVQKCLVCISPKTTLKF